jgi:hypothetical protein
LQFLFFGIRIAANQLANHPVASGLSLRVEVAFNFHGRQRSKGWATLFLAFHHSTPEIAVGLELGGERVVAEALRKTHFAKIAILLDQRLDTPTEVIRKSLSATVEEDLVLDLQPADTIFQNRQFLINIHVESTLMSFDLAKMVAILSLRT